MRKRLVFVAVLVGLLIIAKVAGSRLPNIDWEKKFEQMPDDAPPKWMFRNISAIRENTDRILERLGDPATSEPSDPAPALT